MKKIYFLFLPILHFLLYEIAIAKIQLTKANVYYDHRGKPKTMYVMATNTRGTSMRVQYSANIYGSPDYGYYEVFICAYSNTANNTECLHEIVTEQSFRFANVATPNFAWFIDNFNAHERSLVNTNKFDLCILDGAEYMRKSFLKKSKANLGQRIKMPRYCWGLKLVEQQEKNGKNEQQGELKNRRHKRDVEDDKMCEILSKIEPKKQALLFKMASNDLLPVGSIGIDDYLNEIAAIANVNVAQLLEYDEKEFEKLGKKFGKLIFHRIAHKRMIKIINDADTFENAFGIGSLPTIKLVIEDIKKIAETIKNIDTAETCKFNRGPFTAIPFTFSIFTSTTWPSSICGTVNFCCWPIAWAYEGKSAKFSRAKMNR